MKNYGKQRSTIKPPEIEITETKVFVATNVAEINESAENQLGFKGYEFNLAEYEKDEYVNKQSDEIKALTGCILEMSELVYQ